MNAIQSFGFIILILISPIAVDTLNHFGSRSPEHTMDVFVIFIGSVLVLLGAYYDKNQ